MRYDTINPLLFTKNRQRFARMMRPNAIAIFKAIPEVVENGDANYLYKPNHNIIWLSGIPQTKTMVILYPDNKDKSAKEVLVIERPNEKTEKWDGHLLRKNEATQISGIKNVQFVDSIDAKLQEWVLQADVVYLDTNPHDRVAQDAIRPDLKFVHEFMTRFPLQHYERSAKIITQLRAIKTSEEIEVIKKSIDITRKAFLRVCRFTKPGVMEYEVEAEATHEFIRNGATRHAYTPIFASGDNARTLHYISNDSKCKDGDLLLMDFGAEYAHYNADLSRTIPVNGKFTKRQKEVYDACLAIHRYCASILKPGINYAEYEKLVNKEFERQLKKIGLITEDDINDQDPDSPAYRKYFYHGIGHHIGLNVHDVGSRNEPVKEGMYFTIEPGIYIKGEKIGIRIENEYLLTKDGNIDLFKDIPITTEEIEAAMRG